MNPSALKRVGLEAKADRFRCVPIQETKPDIILVNLAIHGHNGVNFYDT